MSVNMNCCKCTNPATIKDGRVVYCAKHYLINVMGVSSNTVNGKPLYAAAKVA